MSKVCIQKSNILHNDFIFPLQNSLSTFPFFSLKTNYIHIRANAFDLSGIKTNNLDC